MRPFFSPLILVAALSSACATARSHEDVAECDLGIAVKAAEQGVDDRQIGQLFETADESCETSKDFMQVLNEALFNALEVNPRSFLYYYSSSHNRSFIREQIENPTKNSIDLKRITQQLSDISPTNQATYDELMSSLRVAARVIQTPPPE
jgi:hypothetical protein